MARRQRLKILLSNREIEILDEICKTRESVSSKQKLGVRSRTIAWLIEQKQDEIDGVRSVSGKRTPLYIRLSSQDRQKLTQLAGKRSLAAAIALLLQQH